MVLIRRILCQRPDLKAGRIVELWQNALAASGQEARLSASGAKTS
jgi:hypothetical protein